MIQRASAGIPMMHNNGQSVVVRHKEFIGSVSGSSGFAVAYALTLNPGLRATFPWLSGLAVQFQEYDLKGCVFHYVPTSGAAISGTNSALGSVMIQTTYRSSDAPPNNKSSMLNEYWANEVVPSDTMCHPIECDPKENPFNIHYVRAGTIPSGEPLMYDIGTTYVCTQGMQGTNQVGDLWVTYEVELKKPIVSSNVTNLSGYLSGNFDSPSTSNPFNGSLSFVTGNLPVTFVSTGTIKIPQGFNSIFVVQIVVTASPTFSAAAWTGVPTYTNLVSATYLGDSATIPQTVAGATATTTCLTYSFACQVVNPGLTAQIVLPTPSWTGTSSKTFVTITALENY
jgi:hypothetical protein